MLVITMAMTLRLAHGSHFKEPYQYHEGHYRGPRGRQKGVLTIYWGRSANCAKSGGAKCSGLQEGHPCQWDGVREGIREEVTLQLFLVEAGTAYAKAQRQECWGSSGDLDCRVRDVRSGESTGRAGMLTPPKLGTAGV